MRQEKTLLDDYVASGDVKLQFWHILDHGNASLQASAAAECAGQQGAFWTMHDLLFSSQNQLWDGDLNTLNGLAEQAAIDVQVFQSCMESGEMQDRVKKIDQDVKAEGVRVRPTFDLFLEGERVQRIQGSPQIEQWYMVLDNL